MKPVLLAVAKTFYYKRMTFKKLENKKLKTAFKYPDVNNIYQIFYEF